MEIPETRAEALLRLFPKTQKFRLRQVEEAVFGDEWQGWAEVTPLSQEMRNRLVEEKVPWRSHQDAAVAVQESHGTDSFKAALELHDSTCIETVLMSNSRGQWTVCASTQVGCAMQCSFCATGRLGLKRNLNSDEIVDQFRFWQRYIRQMNLTSRISNLVLMGMGEPLANYDNVKQALNLILKYTDIGPTRITVSTVGMIPQLNELLEDKDWPPVRLAVSLHSANSETRKRLMPSSYEQFLELLTDWGIRYERKFGNRRHHLTFEYVMLAGENDRDDDAQRLIDFASSFDRAKINLIPYNATDAEFKGSDEKTVTRFADHLRQAGIDVMRRRSLGQDIDAACGQLANK